MSQAELKTEKNATYNTLIRLIDAEKTQTAAFRKLTERLTWVNNEMIAKGYTGE